MLENNGIGTHFVKLLGEREMLVKSLELLPLRMVARNVVSETFSKRSGLPAGEILPLCAVEYYLDDDAMIDPLTNYEHIKIASSITEGEAGYLRARAVEINSFLRMFFEEKGLILVDFQLEFGKDKNSSILLCDEISLDTCTLWERETHEKLDKDRFRRDLGGAEEDYLAALKRVTGEAI